MKLGSYIIFDKQAKSFNQPMFLANDAVAIRQIRNELMNPNSQISLSPQDFAIYSNGEYDTETGWFEQNVEMKDKAELRLVTEVADIELPNVKEVK
jgi:hypothetical protein